MAPVAPPGHAHGPRLPKTILDACPLYPFLPSVYCHMREQSGKPSDRRSDSG